MAACKHVWIIALNQGISVVLECERCFAVVFVLVEHGPAGHGFMFGIPRAGDQALISNADLQALGDWFAWSVGEPVVLHTPMGKRARRRPGRAA